MKTRLVIVVLVVIVMLALAVSPALGAHKPPGLHKAPAAVKVVHGPAGELCVKCHGAPCAACHTPG